jgi:Spy/CpxP family protein refolding chaperone
MRMNKAIFLLVGLSIFSVAMRAETQSADPIQAYANALKAYDEAAQQLQRANLRAQKKEIIKQALSLTPQQSQRFWPIYEKYEAQTARINDSRLALITEYLNHRVDISSEKATDLINRVMKVQLERQELKRGYLKELGGVLTAKQALRLLLLENQIDVQIDAKIAAQIPL